MTFSKKKWFESLPATEQLKVLESDLSMLKVWKAPCWNKEHRAKSIRAIEQEIKRRKEAL